jgi:hypothetical protein
MPRTRISAAARGLPAATLYEIHDYLVLALDATEGDQPRRWQMPEARGLIRSALRDTRRLMGEVQA